MTDKRYPSELHKARHRRRYWAALVAKYRAHLKFIEVATEMPLPEHLAAPFLAQKRHAQKALPSALKMRDASARHVDALRKRLARERAKA